MPIGQPPDRRDARGQRVVRVLGNQYFGGAQAFDFRDKGRGLDFGGAKTPGRQRKPGDADRSLFLPERQQQAVALVVEQRRVGQRAGGDDAHDFALDRAFRGVGIADLFADRDRFAPLDEPGEILLERMVGHAGHLDWLAGGGAAAGERDIEESRRFFRVAKKELVKIPHAIEQEHVGVLRLDAQVLLHHWSMVAKTGVVQVAVFLRKIACNCIFR